MSDAAYVEFVSSADRLEGEAEERAALAARAIPYPIPFLADTLDSILPHDLVLLGAATGAGKTQLATLIAEAVAERGVPVDYYALEAEGREIERRNLYREVVRLFWEDSPTSHPGRQVLSYRQWFLGKLDFLKPFEADARYNLRKRHAKLHTYYRGREFKPDDLERLVMAREGRTKLIVIDHVHFIDDDDDNENRSGTRLIKLIRDLSIAVGIPVIAIAHLRKRDQRSKRLVPVIDDFHGTSNLTKVVTQVIVLAPAHDRRTGVPGMMSTYVSVQKDRMDGAKPWVASAVFNAKTGLYAERYELGRLSWPDGDKFEAVATEHLPFWARHAVGFEESGRQTALLPLHGEEG